MQIRRTILHYSHARIKKANSKLGRFVTEVNVRQI